MPTADSGREALKALDFYAHADLFMNPTAELADVVLPVASAFEREGLKIGFEISQEAQSLIQLRPAVVPPPGEARPDTDIIFDLAARLGLAAQFWHGDIEAAYRHQLAPTGVTVEQLRAAPGGVRVPLQTRHAKHAEPDAHGAPRGFATPSRKVELYSQTFLDHGYAPLPDFAEPPSSPVARPDLAARFPLILTSAKSALFCQTQHHALPSLRKRAPHPEVELHPAAAQARGIANGDWVSIETPEGSVRARARLNDRPRPPGRGRRARLVAGLRRDRRARLRPVRADGRQLQPAHRHRCARPGQRHGLASCLSVRDSTRCMTLRRANSRVKLGVVHYPVIEVCKQDIDRTLLRENLKLSHAERLLNLMQLQRLAQVLRHAGHRARRARV